MTKVSHKELLERLKSMETADLLYLLVEAKTGRHVDILGKLPRKVVMEAETAIERLVAYSRAAEWQ